jgi:hypothetical protein
MAQNPESQVQVPLPSTIIKSHKQLNVDRTQKHCDIIGHDSCRAIPSLGLIADLDPHFETIDIRRAAGPGYKSHRMNRTNLLINVGPLLGLQRAHHTH